MRSEIRRRRHVLAPALGVTLGVVAGAAATWSTAVAGPVVGEPQAVLDATHLPPLLTTGGPLELAYDVHCVPGGVESVDQGCAVRGSVFVRELGMQAFAELPLEARSIEGRRQLATTVPGEVAGTNAGIEYYAVVEAPELAESLTLPAAGAAAPHVSRPLGAGPTIELGRHVFGSDRRAGVRVATAAWGDGAGQVGLEEGRSMHPVGGSAFDVDTRGTVLLLDQVNHRLLRWARGAAAPARVPVSVNGTVADMVVDDEGSIWVLETTAARGGNPLVRRFDDGGRELEAIETAERTPAQIRLDERGPVVLGQPSHHWKPVLVDGVPASPLRQLERGRAGRRFEGGREVVVLRHGHEVRVAVVTRRSLIRSWRIRSNTPLAEVQLAEPWGQRIVLVVRVYEDGADEFVVLVLGREGLVDRFALPSADWAESAPLGRFRLVGASLYRLGSSPSGVFVDRFDLEVR